MAMASRVRGGSARRGTGRLGRGEVAREWEVGMGVGVGADARSWAV